MLSGLFAVDVTAATVLCVRCGSAGPVARLRLDHHGHGLVAHCAECGEPVLSVVRTEDAVALDLRGTVALTVPLESA
ncbi:hypothetical protein GCM10010121_045210 [Streptomyces brasiliensis]|uniref:Uncharacterized protein n=2 Tax=Streptomyces brasiliensis TaxID=1954 RepID=A0A917KTL4_9ACTN|nr:hypothetical protein GCM10010121_045210 [Streptomyces brasiliensis]